MAGNCQASDDRRTRFKPAVLAQHRNGPVRAAEATAYFSTQPFFAFSTTSLSYSFRSVLRLFSRAVVDLFSPKSPSSDGFKARAFCMRCKRATSECYCQSVVPQTSRAKFVLLQHPREARNPVGTAWMTHLSLPESKLLVGVDFAADAQFRELLEREHEHSVVLFPAPGARDASELAKWQRPLTVWVIDGTWWQAEKIWRLNPTLHSLPAFRIEPTRPSQYQIRNEPAPHCLSTIEAVATLLDAIDGSPGAHEQMLQPFVKLVERQQSHAVSSARLPRWRRLRQRPRSVQALTEPLPENLDRVLLFYAEGNGWPARMENAPKPELVQWMALRPETGERFSMLVRPPSGWSPACSKNLNLREEELANALEVGDFVESWSRFQRPDELWYTWGHFSAKLLARAGISPPRYVDIRPIANRLLSCRIGNIDEARELPEIVDKLRVDPMVQGRGGRRIALLEAVFYAMMAKVEEGLQPARSS